MNLVLELGIKAIPYLVALTITLTGLPTFLAARRYVDRVESVSLRFARNLCDVADALSLPLVTMTYAATNVLLTLHKVGMHGYVWVAVGGAALLYFILVIAALLIQSEDVLTLAQNEDCRVREGKSRFPGYVRAVKASAVVIPGSIDILVTALLQISP